MAKQYKILIVEDDPIIAEDLYAQMKEAGFEAIGPASNVEDALKLLRSESPHLCLLDVHLGGEIDGIQLAAMIREKSDLPIVFLTAFNDRDTVERIKTAGPSAYLVKPVDERNLKTTVELSLSNFYSDESSLKKQESPKEVPESIFIKVKDKLNRFKLDEILYFEAYDNYAFLHTKTARHILSTSLKQVEEKLPADIFIRTHRSFIVNLNRIEGIGNQYLLINGKEIPIGKTYRDSLMNRIALL